MVTTPHTDPTTQASATRVAARTLWSKAHVGPKLSGIAGVSVFISEGTSQGKALLHGPRVVVRSSTGQLGESSVTIGPGSGVVTGAIPVKILNQVVGWIDLNRPMLMRLWKGQLDQQQAMAAVRSIDHAEPVVFFHPSLEATKRALLPGEFITDERSFAKERGEALAIEAGKAEYYLHQVLGTVGAQVTRGGTNDVWNASVRLAVEETKTFTAPR